MKKPLAIYGAGGLGKEILSLISALPDWQASGFYDDGLQPGAVVRDGITVLGGMNELLKIHHETNVVLAIGSPEAKLLIARKLEANPHIVFPQLIHPSVIMQDPSRIRMGPGAVLAAGTILTTDVQIGAYVLLNLNCTVGHDVVIGRCSSVMPGVNLAGEVKIGEGVLIGSGANIINRLSIGDHSKVGAGAVVLCDIPPDTTAVGVPARTVKR